MSLRRSCPVAGTRPGGEVATPRKDSHCYGVSYTGKDLMLGKTEGRRSRWLDGVADSRDMSLSKLRELGVDRRPGAPRPMECKEPDTTERPSNSNTSTLARSSCLVPPSLVLPCGRAPAFSERPGLRGPLLSRGCRRAADLSPQFLQTVRLQPLRRACPPAESGGQLPAAK